MQRWEYLNVVKSRGKDDENKIGDWCINCYPPAELPVNDPNDFLTILGEQGWELVSAWPLAGISGKYWAGISSQEKWVFKRPKQN